MTYVKRYNEKMEERCFENRAKPSNRVVTGVVFDLGKVKIEFSVVSDRGDCQPPDAFYCIKKYCS